MHTLTADERTHSTAGSLAGSPTGQDWRVSASLPVSYDVRVCEDLLAPENPAFEEEAFGGPSPRRLVIVEQRVHDLFGDRLATYFSRRGLDARLVCVTADEAVKDSALGHRLLDAIDDFGIDRRTEPIIAIGGGVLLDVVGWVAGMYRRGTPYIRVPTTLIGLVDAGIGVKTAVNRNGHKNIIGSYHAPVRALLDPCFLTTLPDRHLSNGMAEIAKMGIVADEILWKLLAEHAGALVPSALGFRDEQLRGVGHEVISRSVHSMLVELQPNLWEGNLERVVDFGHTLSPSLEMAVLPELLHGEAVSIDMAVSCAVSTGRGLLAQDDLAEIVRTLLVSGLPVSHDACTPELLEQALSHTTRHRGGMQRFPAPVRPGQAVFLEGVTVTELTDAVRLVRQIEEHCRVAV
ncbi:sedoheptulose 7-phosphate cyclase [Streptomyces sp. NPDC020472]|uniref:sedoheptulose 7-phosphate cyclase n=1 Tax=Streptomyces sp. NPDC020472 TaxID=3365075 RepID=UPI00378EA60D